VVLLTLACDSDPAERLTPSLDDGSGHTAPSQATVRANAAVLDQLPFEDQTDFTNARRGFIAAREDPRIESDAGGVVWNLDEYAFQQGPAPDSVNPSLWRQAKLNNIHGLFEVSEGIYQVRGYDLANLTLIEGETGWIVIDVMTTRETAHAAMELVRKHLGDRPVSAVIYTHSHIDHFGGIRGVIGDADIERGIPIIAPEGFLEEAVSENVLAGTAMARRASYMFGFLLDRHPRGHVDSGLGKASTPGTYGLVAPNRIVTGDDERMVIDGIELIFHNTPGAEAPAEMMISLPAHKAFCGAENVSHVLHNVLTLRGAKVRDALRWSTYIDEAIDRLGEVEVLFASHHWPTWGNAEVIDQLKKQRDIYKYLHDQGLRLANAGLTPREIAEEFELPESLAKTFAVRGYYGTPSHNVKAVYQHYFGWFDGNPANLEPLPPVAAAERYVEAMGGGAAVLERASVAAERGEYRWAAELLDHLVFAEPKNQAARAALADVYDQLGYQAESGPWRDFYLSGANELRGRGRRIEANLTPIEVISAMPTSLFFDALAVRLDGAEADGDDTVLNFVFDDIGETHVVDIENAVLHHRQATPRDDAHATVTLTRDTWNLLLSQQLSLPAAIADGAISVDGSALRLLGFFAMLDTPEADFGVVEP